MFRFSLVASPRVVIVVHRGLTRGNNHGGTMSAAEKLEQLARRIPGVAGYLDKEKSRATDHALRMSLVEALDGLKHTVEAEQQRLTELHALDDLGDLGRLSAKLDKISNEVRYASRGYRGFFDNYKLTQEKLDQLYDFDLNLLNEVEAIRLGLEKLSTAHEAVGVMDAALDRFEVIFSRRTAVLLAE